MKVFKNGHNKYLIDITDLELGALCELQHHALKDMEKRSFFGRPSAFSWFQMLQKLNQQIKDVL